MFYDFESGMPDEFSDDTNDFVLNLGCSGADSEADCETSDEKGLAEWAAEYNISQNALSALSKILRQKGLHVPLDARTLMSTERKCDVKNVAGGVVLLFWNLEFSCGRIGIFTFGPKTSDGHNYT